MSLTDLKFPQTIQWHGKNAGVFAKFFLYDTYNPGQMF